MRIIAKKTLQDFWEKHPDSRQPLEDWYHITRRSNWKNLNDVLNAIPKVSILKNNRVVFNIKGNDYRLIVLVKFTMSTIFIRWVGNHSDYDKINANTI